MAKHSLFKPLDLTIQLLDAHNGKLLNMFKGHAACILSSLASIHATCPPTDMSWLPHHMSHPPIMHLRHVVVFHQIEDMEGVKNMEEIVNVPVRLT